MASLTQIAVTTRKIIRYSIFFIIFLIIGRIILGIGIGIFNKVFPAPPPPATIAFGPLPKITFPDNKNLPTLTYTLQTPTGELPKMPIQATVYRMPKEASNLSSLDATKRKAAALGFTNEPVSESQTLYKFTHPIVPATLEMNIVTGVFSVSYDLSKDPTPISQRPPSPEVAADNVKSYLKGAGLLPDDIEAGTSTHDFLKIENKQLVPAISLSESSLIKVNFFREEYDKMPSLTPHPAQGNIWFLVAGSQTREKIVIGGEFHYFPIDATLSSTYPIKTPQVAYEELSSGKGYIADLGLNSTGNVTIRKVYLAHFDPDTQMDFFQPIYVFEGDNGFIAYVPAITDSYYLQK
ncbi:MAG TPA: hypothetical protein VF185_01600 [Patescibacteria group bacterium]